MSIQELTDLLETTHIENGNGNGNGNGNTDTISKWVQMIKNILQNTQLITTQKPLSGLRYL